MSPLGIFLTLCGLATLAAAMAVMGDTLAVMLETPGRPELLWDTLRRAAKGLALLVLGAAAAITAAHSVVMAWL